MDWYNKLNSFGKNMLRELGYDGYIPTDKNPITEALRDPQFVARFKGNMKSFNRTQLSRTATICQMEIYDSQNGPEMDGRLTSIREQWYRWYKVKFAQPLAVQYGDKMEENELGVMDIDGLAWFGRMSQTYGWIVDNLKVTYKQLWIEDASRKMEQFYQQLFRDANIIVALEKDGMVKRFSAMAHALGARTVYSGKGKSGKAAIELLLREHFGWSERYNPFTEENPLVVIHISDYDYDGEVVIGPTFAKQIRRYTSNVLEARIGIKPTQVEEGDWSESWYMAKIKNNKAYIKWANEKGLYRAKCADCGNTWAVLQTGEHECPNCPTGYAEVKLGGGTQVYGFEVEALYTKDYTELLVGAYLSVVTLDYVIEKLRDECQADASSAASQIKDEILTNNESYQALLEEFDRLEEIKEEFEYKIQDAMYEIGRSHIGDWRDDDEDPTAEDFEDHVGKASVHTGPWRPFNSTARTAKLAEWLKAPYTKLDDDTMAVVLQLIWEPETVTSLDIIADFEKEEIDW